MVLQNACAVRDTARRRTFDALRIVGSGSSFALNSSFAVDMDSGRS
jgi:hypothetical protein